MNRYFICALFFCLFILPSKGQTTSCYYLEKTGMDKTEKTKITMDIIDKKVKATLVKEIVNSKGQKTNQKNTYEGRLEGNKILFGTTINPEAKKFFDEHGVKTGENQQWILKERDLEIDGVVYKNGSCN